MSEQREMQRRLADDRRAKLYDSQGMRSAREAARAKPTAADAMAKRHADERGTLEQRHRAEGTRLGHKHQMARDKFRSVSSPLPQHFDRDNSRERADLNDRHKRERDELTRKHMAERDHALRSGRR